MSRWARDVINGCNTQFTAGGRGRLQNLYGTVDPGIVCVSINFFFSFLGIIFSNDAAIIGITLASLALPY